jgi:hypothetical protein
MNNEIIRAVLLELAEEMLRDGEISKAELATLKDKLKEEN